MPIVIRPSRSLRRWLLPLLMALLVAATGIPIHAQTLSTSARVVDAAYDPASLHAIKPELRDEVAATLPAGLTQYDIDVTFPAGPEDHQLSGAMTVTYTNTTGDVLADLPFRLYANSAANGHQAVVLDAVSVDGSDIEPALSERNSVAMLALPEPLAPGDAVTIDVTFTTTVPVDERAHYGIFNYATTTDTWSLAHWYPVVAGRDPDTGWMLDPTSVNGDPIFTDTGMYTVRITAPSDLQFIASGVRIASEDAGDGMTTATWSAAPSRDFVMMADTDMASREDEVDGTTVISWFHDGHAASGEAALRWTAQSLDLFNDLLGGYPYLTLQVAEAEIFNAAGVEYPQLFTVSDSYYEGAPDLDAHGYFEFTVVHEVVHQWFYGLVGNNQYTSAFIDEGLTNYLSSRVYFTALYGDETGERVFRQNIEAPFRSMIESNGDVIVATRTDGFPSEGSYVNAVYVKAPMGFAAIYATLGDTSFFPALQAYVQAFRFRVATPDDLLGAFEATGGTGIEATWSRWFERREGSLDLQGVSSSASPC